MKFYQHEALTQGSSLDLTMSHEQTIHPKQKQPTSSTMMHLGSSSKLVPYCKTRLMPKLWAWSSRWKVPHWNDYSKKLKVDHKNRYGILEGVKLASQIMPLKNARNGRKLILISNGKMCSNLQQWFLSIDSYPFSINFTMWPSHDKKCYSLNDKVFSHPKFKSSQWSVKTWTSWTKP